MFKMLALKLQVYDILKTKFTDKEATKVIELFNAISENKVETQTKKFETIVNKDLEIVETKIDKKISESKTEILKTIYVVGLVQFLAIVGSVLMIINFMIKK